MSSGLEISTLGGLRITCQGQPLSILTSRKAEALLVYLVWVQRPCSREVLAELFWPERSQTQSLTNLRKILVDLRQKVNSFLIITRDTIGINAASSFWLDVKEFERLMAEAEQCSPDKYASTEQLKTALALYKGDFLEGFYIDSRGFEDWMLLERERLRFSATYILDLLVEEYLRKEETQAGLECISRLMKIDALREKTYRQAMRLMINSDQREAALAQYDTCQRILKTELGITPSQDTIELYESIRAGGTAHHLTQVVSTPGRTTNFRRTLPIQATVFIGREEEVQELLEQIKAPDCRLLSIVGPGGIGKTRLGLEVARRSTSYFNDGVAFVPLAPVRTSEDMISAIIASLAIPVREGEHDLPAILLDYLADKILLLVLDNMEHLVDDLGLIDEIFAAAPQVRIIATSRQPLSLAWEWQFYLEGMPVPDRIEDARSENYSSIRLFVERARHVQRSFQLTDDIQGVIRICQLVEGLPLGIELAAAWLRMMPCHEIAERLIELETPHKPVEMRHRSLRALFENIWARLSNHEQQLLMRLSVFRGGFDSHAALLVTGMNLPDLAALVNESLLSANYRANRYDMHQLLNQFIRDKLRQNPDEEQQALDAHSGYYTHFLEEREAQLHDSPQAVADIQADIDNVRAAWQHAVDRQRFDWIARCSTSLNSFYTLRSLQREALIVFQRVLDMLVMQPETPERDQTELILQSCLYSPMSVVYSWMSPKLWPVAERIRELAERLGNDRQTLLSLLLLTNLYGNEEWERSVAVAQEAVSFSQRLGKQEQMAAYVTGECPLIWTGRFSLALDYSRSGQNRFDPNNCLWATTFLGCDPLVVSLSHMGKTLCILGYIDQGYQAFRAAQERADLLEQPFAQAFAWGFTALTLHMVRDTVNGMAAAKHIHQIAKEHEFSHWASVAPCYIASLIIEQRDYEAGIASMVPAIEKWMGFGMTHMVTLRLANLAHAYGMTGRIDQAFVEINKALTLAQRVGERGYLAEVYRTQGELHSINGDKTAAEVSFEQSIEIARQQEAKLFELQSTLSLCRLYQQQGYWDEAQSRLTTIYNWFTEGFDKPDLVAARTLLEELE